mmetsp:Transcript_344/g.599  ORF Transcript_344/g.599 Transcript_344/m.599 type:complete len:136 (-) Transcript_344:57-464(-)|eukprot:CAMPEP_0184677846 /NCGR_PEP_ID=MMETSP0312-20130426/451_1 /TAXON_ID=31354 /ORGANISM="Compsopogon coeruleus, Strain SAG 36.94" /LENGTH=135 /DNA_ID=CAMNT_0027126021 /DNA_START=73 /DNA_END=480 /DNA_ORIENTATION=+
MAFVPGVVVGVRGGAVRARSSFVGGRVMAVVPKARATLKMEYELSDSEMYDNNPVVLFLALAGWILPSSIPTGIPLFEGSGLTPAFLNSINANLAKWPAGPAADDPFWTLLFMWHLGMFATMIFGSIGYQIAKNK